MDEKMGNENPSIKITWQINDDGFSVRLKFRAGDLVVNKHTSVLMKIENLAKIEYEPGFFRYMPEYDCINVLSQFPGHSHTFKESDLVHLSEVAEKE